MLFNQDRKQQREFLAKAWQKYTNQQLLEPLEKELVSIIKIHPEYQKRINNIDSEYFPEHGEVNPFLHINLHLSLREQLSIKQPAGIKEIYQKLLDIHKDPHQVEHLMMDCIAQMIFTSQKNNDPIDEDTYLDCLKKQIKQG